MTFNTKKHKNDLLFLPLGGAGEIGMNLNLYHLDGKWLIIDFGAGFADDFLPGVDMIVPDVSFIEQNQADIVGLVLTHAHEDHLGALTHLWGSVKFPIYATPFTAAFLKLKLLENGIQPKTKINIVQPGSQFSVGPFDLEMIQLTHSVPEMNAVIVKTKHGNIFHSGDWKLDPDPMIGPVSEMDKLKSIGDEGILAMVSDSTNVFSKGKSGSEGDLRTSLFKLISECTNLVIVTTFASNVARLESIAKAAGAAGRKIVIAGRSIWRIINAAKEAGYLKDLPEFLDESQIKSFHRSEILIIATGCQGELMAAVNKIVNNNHRNIKILPGDSVIFSSKIIPGNEKRIFRLFNQLARDGIEVLTEKDHFVHVSGHPNRDDLKEMYEVVRPKIAIPVHGEDVHMVEHVKLAKSFGVKEAIKIANGEIVKLAPGNVQKIGTVASRELAVDGNSLLDPKGAVMKMRRRIQKDGVVVVTIILDNSNLVCEPVVCAPGLLDLIDDKELVAMIQEELCEVVEVFLRTNAHKIRHSIERLDNIARAAIRRIIRIETGKNPPIEITVKFI